MNLTAMQEIIQFAEGHSGFIFEFKGEKHRMPMRDFHTHRELELNVVTSGMGKYLLPGRQYTLEPGSIAWFFPKHPHMLLEWSDNYRMFVIVFRRRFIQSHCKSESLQLLKKLNPKGYFCRFIPKENLQSLVAVCQTLVEGNPELPDEDPVRAWAGQAFGNIENQPYRHRHPPLLNAGLAFLMLLAWSTYITAEEHSHFRPLHPSVEKALIAIGGKSEHETIADGGLTEIANYCGLSPSRLSRLFHEQIGIPLVQYRNQKRIERFIQIYNFGPGASLTETAYKAGFGSYAQFQKTFKNIFGYSPAEYRKRKWPY